MATEILVGSGDGTIDAQYLKNYFCPTKFTASTTGTCSEVRIKVSGNGNVKVAIYADSAGEPGARLAKQDTPAAVTTGWNTIALEASCSLTINTVYWLAFITDTDSIVGYDTHAAVALRYRAETYSTFTFPDPAGSGFSSITDRTTFIAGWGTTVQTITVPLLTETITLYAPTLTYPHARRIVYVEGSLAGAAEQIVRVNAAENGFEFVPSEIENRTSDPTSPDTGRIWLRTDL